MLALSWAFEILGRTGHPNKTKLSTENHTETVQEITLNFSDCPRSWITSIDWAAFVATVTSLSCLKRVIVWVREGTEQATALEEHARQHLVLLAQESGIELTFESPKRGPW